MSKIGFILKLPLLVTFVGSVAAGVYAAYAKISGITWVTPIILGTFLVLYIVGSLKDRNKSQPKDVKKEEKKEDKK